MIENLGGKWKKQKEIEVKELKELKESVVMYIDNDKRKDLIARKII